MSRQISEFLFARVVTCLRAVAHEARGIEMDRWQALAYGCESLLADLTARPDTVACPDCRGRGYLVVSERTRNGDERDTGSTADCERCRGTGRACVCGRPRCPGECDVVMGGVES